MRSAVAILALLCCASLAAALENPLVKNVVGKPVGQAGSFTGTLKITKALRVNNVLHLGGVITGGVLKTVGTDGKEVTTDIPLIDLGSGTSGGRKLLQAGGPIAVGGVTGSCEILNLQIGRINLDVLGLVINLEPVDLNITAQSGPGNLLGNLLCAVANLLNGGLNLNLLVRNLQNLINNLLAGLGG